MEYKKLSNGILIPEIGLGTWGIGGEFIADTSNEENEVILIRQAINLGMHHIDTAEIYSQGQAEKEIGFAIKNFDREKLFITTKVWKTNLHKKDVMTSLEKSLERLQTNYVDLYIVHWPNPAVPLKETMEAMEYLASKGKIKSIGVSNFSVDQMKEAQRHLKNYKIVANQVEYNLTNKYAEEWIIPYCIENNIIVVAYKPLARGNLASKFPGVLSDIARKYNKTTAQIALKWTISHKNVVAITKSSSLQHINENMGIFGWEIKKKDIELLDKLS